jgi:L,D-transpeptidase catalytic domain
MRVVPGVVAVLAAATVGVVVRGAVPISGAAPAPPMASGGDRLPDAFSPAAVVSREVPRGSSLIVAPERRSIRVYRRPGARRTRLVRARVFEGQRIPLRFMVLDKRRGWVRVQLADASSRWVRRRDVRLTHTPYKLVVERPRRRLVLLRSGRVVKRFRIAVGAQITPTPRGRYFVTDLIRSRDPFYGPYVLGLSARTREQLGIHGTSVPSSIGQRVSRGCIRVHNGVIRRLARIVPIGTPVVIR